MKYAEILMTGEKKPKGHLLRHGDRAKAKKETGGWVDVFYNARAGSGVKTHDRFLTKEEFDKVPPLSPRREGNWPRLLLRGQFAMGWPA